MRGLSWMASKIHLSVPKCREMRPRICRGKKLEGEEVLRFSELCTLLSLNWKWQEKLFFFSSLSYFSILWGHLVFSKWFCWLPWKSGDRVASSGSAQSCVTLCLVDFVIVRPFGTEAPSYLPVTYIHGNNLWVSNTVMTVVLRFVFSFRV